MKNTTFLRILSSFAVKPVSSVSSPLGHTLALLCILLYASLGYLLGLSCPLYALTRIPCPGCGMTRAMMAALQFDFPGAYAYHRMFWSVPLLLLLFVYDGFPFVNRTANRLLHLFLIAGFLLNWLLNI